MSTENRIWALVAIRLSHGSSIEDLRELDELLKNYSGLDWQIKIIAGWWQEDIREEVAQRGALIFDKIKEEIKVKEETGKSEKSSAGFK